MYLGNSYPSKVYHYAPYKGGFTILEIITVVAIIGTLAGAIIPVTLHVTRSKRESATREELQVMKKAIIGGTLSTEWGKEATFGYLGDMGSLPQDLEDLYIQRQGVPSFSFDSTLGIGSGWRGPYVAKKAYTGITDFLKDPYGRPYAYSTASYTDTNTGAEVWGTIRSLGRDGINNTPDDLTVEILRSEILADATGRVNNTMGAGVPKIFVTIHYSSGGTLTSSTTQTDMEGRYQFFTIPMGERAITLQPGLVYIPGTAFANIDITTNLQEVEFSVANLSSSDITVSSITTHCYTNPDTYYGRIRIKDINGTLLRDVPLFPRLGTEAGTPVGFAPLAVAGSTMQREAYRFLLQSSQVEIPDIELSTIGAGGVMTIELQDFAYAPTGVAPADMAGVPFRVTFSNGSTVLFTPKRR